MNGFLCGFLFVTVTTVCAVLGMLLVRARVSLATLSSYHQVAGYLLSVIGTLYAVLLGFVVVEAMQDMQDVRGLVSLEASGLANIFLCANGLPAAKRDSIQSVCRQYAEEVINDEWITLQRGHYSQKTFHSAFTLWKEITTLDSATEREQLIQQQLLTEVCTMTQNHRTRVVNSTRGVAPIMWVALTVGGIFTVVFTYFFGVENIKVQALMTILVSIVLSLNLCLVFVFGNPMLTDLGVKPGPFRLDLDIFEGFEKGEMPLAHPIYH
jgi:hypothetical protein